MILAIDLSSSNRLLSQIWQHTWNNLAEAFPAWEFVFFLEENDRNAEKHLPNIRWQSFEEGNFHLLGKQAGFQKKLRQTFDRLHINVWVTLREDHLLPNFSRQFWFPEVWPEAITGAVPAGFLKAMKKKAGIVVLHACFIIPVQQWLRTPSAIAAGLLMDNSAAPLSWSEKLPAKVAYAAGNDYFLAICGAFDEAMLIELLKGFSTFKKWQQSGLNLVIVLPAVAHNDALAWKEKLASYRYREHVHVIYDANVQQQTALIGSSYALMIPGSSHMLMAQVFTAAAMQIPVIASENWQLRALLGDAILYVPHNAPVLTGQKMILLYKDEELLKSNVNEALGIMAAFNGTGVTSQWKGLLEYP